MAGFIKNDTTFEVDYKDTHCNHEIKNDDDDVIGREHEDDKMTIKLTNKGKSSGVLIEDNEIVTTDCFVIEEDPDCDGDEHQRFTLNDNTSNIVRGGDKITTHTNEDVILESNFTPSKTVIGKNVKIGTKK